MFDRQENTIAYPLELSKLTSFHQRQSAPSVTLQPKPCSREASDNSFCRHTPRLSGHGADAAERGTIARSHVRLV